MSLVEVTTMKNETTRKEIVVFMPMIRKVDPETADRMAEANGTLVANPQPAKPEKSKDAK
jgi:hypothetical protein